MGIPKCWLPLVQLFLSYALLLVFSHLNTKRGWLVEDPTQGPTLTCSQQRVYASCLIESAISKISDLKCK